jgi:prepilin-type N-terminal cleavage/methylation domain-containing protein
MRKKLCKGIFRNNRGFSLIELLVVITIMGILAGVAIPRFINVLDQAKKRADESNIHTIKSAAQVFFFETGDWPEVGF